ncbi:hypothetical protein LTR10_013548 [Elasticomyces elasticus]|uniref:Telomeric single stranded DNA binding POT1/Cdc13 domain-containing protein n=1 Tax=Exophiala sideris TaxID=1016849 RepID=A0ABR0JQ87_9EURO|nr:hypothetical protein LTR10_013548 [Elasticomyces elasticus]KAK5039686.1 hypothetical protein LTS07_000181 [Exophiala sideris]KAK5041238.1 hypothetical protein LTR13_002713 [Exophiala sideris]KAK5068063.1 hypothetical protein LTR69_000181 [Exophiala sideris]KAK5187365.1 hypothetical protein LTR44_000181 [Eurotiomycetes sp. CCFEE 6388]
MTRMIVLAGAPESNKLDWSEKALLPNSMHVESITSPTSQAFGAQWRQITNAKLQMRPILPKLSIEPRPTQDDIDRSGAEFFSADEHIGTQTPGSDVSCNESQPSGGSTETTSEALSDYYEHSYSIHTAIPSSQLSGFSDYTPGTPTYESNQEMFPQTPGSGGGIIRSPSQPRLGQAPRPKHLSDLEDIPNARYLSSIEPQTMTVNLIVGILSISPPRMVVTGTKYGRPRETELIEMVVGDNTKTGFVISMWLPREMHVNWKDGAHATPEGSRSILRRSLRFMRPRDVVLLQNVALSSFRGKVHGQSLKGDVTKIDLLFRKKVDDDDIGGIYTLSNLRTAKDPQVLKVKKVRDWMMEFVGDRDRSTTRRRREGHDYGFLPEDTQSQ